MRKFGNVTKFSSLQKVCCVSGPHLFDLDPDHCSRSGSVGFVSFRPPGSGSVIICTDQDLDLNPDPAQDPLINKQKKLRKAWNSAVL
jgi:hypothetical protein